MGYKYPEHRTRFIEALRSADMPAGRASSDAIAETLECSESHVRNLFLGNKRYCGRTKHKLDSLIAAKGDGQTGISDAVRGATEPVEQFEVDLPGPALMGSMNPQRLGFEVIKQPGKSEYLVVEVDAVFRDEERAQRYCDMLNKGPD